MDRVLVAGSYPPLPGAAAARTLGVVQAMTGRGAEVTVVSPRPTAAHHYGRLVGWRAGWTLRRLRRLTGAEQLMLCTEPGMPFVRGRPWQRRATIASLAWAMGGFGSVVIDDGSECVIEPVDYAAARRALRSFVHHDASGSSATSPVTVTVSGPSEWQHGARLWFAAALAERQVTRMAHRLLGRYASPAGSALRFVLRPLRHRLLGRTR